MPGTHAPYPPEFRRQTVELVASGRSIEELAKEFEPSSVDEGRRTDGLTAEERDELRQLRRETQRLRMEQDPKRAAARSWDSPAAALRLAEPSVLGSCATGRRVGCDD